jgi:hypothetical protein
MNIKIQTLPLKVLVERYGVISAGDYWRDEDGTIQIRVADLNNEDMEFLVALHELCEQYLTFKRGIKEEDIQKFDQDHPDSEEPGAEPDSPYYKEHQIATIVEMIMANALGVNWIEYDQAIADLGE